MDLGASTNWWLVAGLLVAAELVTGTFYLLMLALGAAAGALAAHAGFSSNTQMVCAAVLGGGAVAMWVLRNAMKPVAAQATANADVNLDIGSPVQVPQWLTDGTARIHYRGADWDARFVGTDPPSAGQHVIRAIEGNRLLLDRAAP